jgi:hypothetical protein
MPDPFQHTTRTFLETGRLFREQFGQNFASILKQLQTAGAPILSDISRSAAIQGQSAGQDISSALARMGASGTGPGLIARSIAGTLAANQTSQARAGFLQQLLGLANQGAQGTSGMQLGAALGDIGTRSAQRPWWEQLFQNIPGAAGAAIGGL